MNRTKTEDVSSQAVSAALIIVLPPLSADMALYPPSEDILCRFSRLEQRFALRFPPGFGEIERQASRGEGSKSTLAARLATFAKKFVDPGRKWGGIWRQKY